MSVDIFVARHGQNEDNANGIVGGHRDMPLTDLGRQQANNLAEAILDLGLAFDAVYSSPLIRASETAEIISKVAHLPKPQVKQNLIERDCGYLTGKPASFLKTLPDSEVIKTDEIIYFLDPEGGETFDHTLERAREVIKEINELHAEGRVLLVCHGDTGKMIYAATMGKSWREALTDFHFGNAELIDLSGNGDVHTIKFEQFNH
jgi:broad specificity phosphatase PhoE